MIKGETNTQLDNEAFSEKPKTSIAKQFVVEGKSKSLVEVEGSQYVFVHFKQQNGKKKKKLYQSC